MTKYAILLLLALSIGGCSGSFFNPYQEEMPCDKAKNGGKCQSTIEAYENSLNSGDSKEPSSKGGRKGDKDLTSSKTLYQDLSFKKINSLLEQPIVPILSPPKTVRVLVLPSQNQESKTFSTGHYKYRIVEEAKFILSRPLEK